MVRKKMNFYSEEFKNQAVKEFSISNESLKTVAQKFGISHFTLHDWVYHRGKSSKRKKMSILPASNSLVMEKEDLSPSELKALVLQLEKDLSLEKMRSESLSKMIEIAEREFKISIRKKSGAKQSLK